MSNKRRDFRCAMLGWTLFTTVFLWTPTNRMLFKPELAKWKIGFLEGAGRSEFWWVLPALAVLALFAFYLQGRGRLRPVFHGLLLAWHLGLAGLVCGVVAVHGLGASFEGMAWGVEIPLALLAFPFLLAAALSVAWVVGEMRGSLPVRRRSWTAVNGRLLVIALALFAPAIALYRLGEGYDVLVRIAIVMSVVQWILLVQGLEGGAPDSKRSGPVQEAGERSSSGTRRS